MKKTFDIRTDEIKLKAGFWESANKRNLNALLHQWAMMEKSGTIDNFRIAAGIKQGQRKGYSYTDSDFYKWIEAASLQLKTTKEKTELNDQDTVSIISSKLNEAINLIAAIQTEDGYIFTWNQICSKSKRRWKALLVDHEVYCMGHLIEAGVSHFQMTQEKKLITIAQKAANLIIKELIPGKKITGHPEIEFALIRLYDLNGNIELLQAAQQLIILRNSKKTILWQLINDATSNFFFTKTRFMHSSQRINQSPKFVMGDNPKKNAPRFNNLRLLKSLMDGSYFITGKNNKTENHPKGHAVRFLYFKTAEAALNSRQDTIEVTEKEKPYLRSTHSLTSEYETIINHYLHPHGGLGDLPGIEGFSPAFAGNSETAYCESCASTAMVNWSSEMFNLTLEPIYQDMIEWQFYNAIYGTFNQEGNKYYYRHPLNGDINDSRVEWHNTPCCPSNVSRHLASITQHIYKETENELFINQYISNTVDINRTGTWIEMDSNLPFGNEVTLRITNRVPRNYRLNLRIPSWAEGYVLYINGKKNSRPEIIMPPIGDEWESHFVNSSFLTVDMNEETESKSIRIIFSKTVRTIDQRPEKGKESVQKCFYKNAMLYCLEECFNKELFSTDFKVDLNIPAVSSKLPQNSSTTGLKLFSNDGQEIWLTPYALHGNHGDGGRKIWLKYSGGIGDFSI